MTPAGVHTTGMRTGRAACPTCDARRLHSNDAGRHAQMKRRGVGLDAAEAAPRRRPPCAMSGCPQGRVHVSTLVREPSSAHVAAHRRMSCIVSKTRSLRPFVRSAAASSSPTHTPSAAATTSSASTSCVHATSGDTEAGPPAAPASRPNACDALADADRNCSDCVIPTLEGIGINESKCPTCGQPGWKKELQPHLLLRGVATLLCSLQQPSKPAGAGAPAVVLVKSGHAGKMRRIR